MTMSEQMFAYQMQNFHAPTASFWEVPHTYCRIRLTHKVRDSDSLASLRWKFGCRGNGVVGAMAANCMGWAFDVNRSLQPKVQLTTAAMVIKFMDKLGFTNPLLQDKDGLMDAADAAGELIEFIHAVPFGPTAGADSDFHWILHQHRGIGNDRVTDKPGMDNVRTFRSIEACVQRVAATYTTAAQAPFLIFTRRR